MRGELIVLRRGKALLVVRSAVGRNQSALQRWKCVRSQATDWNGCGSEFEMQNGFAGGWNDG